MARFRINTPSVVSDFIADEVIGIDLESGNYYSMRGSAAGVWRVLGHGASAEEVLAELDARYRDVDPAAVLRFLDELTSERLIVADDAAASAPAPVPQETRAPFETPRFERFTDMQEFLLVDPIHEVDVTQWPERRAKNG